jgi:hypothetical protein
MYAWARVIQEMMNTTGTWVIHTYINTYIHPPQLLFVTPCVYVSIYAWAEVREGNSGNYEYHGCAINRPPVILRICTPVCVYVCVCVCMYVSICMCLYVCVCVCVHVHVHVHVHVNVYVLFGNVHTHGLYSFMYANVHANVCMVLTITYILLE